MPKRDLYGRNKWLYLRLHGRIYWEKLRRYDSFFLIFCHVYLTAFQTILMSKVAHFWINRRFFLHVYVITKNNQTSRTKFKMNLIFIFSTARFSISARKYELIYYSRPWKDAEVIHLICKQSLTGCCRNYSITRTLGVTEISRPLIHCPGEKCLL